MKLSQILTYHSILTRIIDEKLDVKPVTKFKLLGLLKSLEPAVSNFNIIRDEKIKQYGKEDKETGAISISKEDTESIDNFNKDLNDLLNSEVDITISKIKVNDIFDSGIPADYLVYLYDLIEE